jgi:hypothetical protein
MTPLAASSSECLSDCIAPGEKPVTLAELRVGGIHFPAAVVSELKLNGYGSR